MYKQALILVLLVLPAIAWAIPSVPERLTRIENILDSQINVDILNQLIQLQQEMSELRGKLEEQQNALQNLSNKQDKMFMNLDSRIGNDNKTADNQVEQSTAVVIGESI